MGNPKGKKGQRKETPQAVKNIPTSIRENRMPKAEAQCFSSTNEKIEMASAGYLHTSCPILLARVQRSLLKKGRPVLASSRHESTHYVQKTTATDSKATGKPCVPA